MQFWRQGGEDYMWEELGGGSRGDISTLVNAPACCYDLG